MLGVKEECSKYDLSSVETLFTGAAPLGPETAADFLKVWPNVLIRQGYGKQKPMHEMTQPIDLLLYRLDGDMHGRQLNSS
jgi:acyl-CoA synthetase (AMP-forming)/AMP-acid ligase II